MDAERSGSDVQRQRLYDAEALVAAQLDGAARGRRRVEVAGTIVTLPAELRFGSLVAAGEWAEAIRVAPWFADRYPRAAAIPLGVRARRGDRAATYHPPGTIALPTPDLGEAWALRATVVAHEVAHHAVHHDRPGVAAHGAVYAGALWRIVGHAISPEVGLLYAAAFDLHGVDVSA